MLDGGDSHIIQLPNYDDSIHHRPTLDDRIWEKLRN